MEAACVRHSEIPHTSRLFLDFQYHFDRVKQYYRYPPREPASFAAAAGEIAFPDERRAALAAALRAHNGASASLDRLAEPGTVAVVTGQQVGLFSGPAYTIYKALTAARLAKWLTGRGIQAVPVFWLATEDHDAAEVNHAYVFGPDHRPRKLVANAGAGPEQPAGTIALTDLPLPELRQALAGFPYANEAFEAAAEAYQPGATYGQAFERLLRKLLAKWDLIYVDPLDGALRNIAAPLLRQALLSADELKEKVLRRNRELVASGYHAQVYVEPQTSFFFLLEGGRRIALRQQNGHYRSKEGLYSVEELAAKAESLSPNALLRPVVQDYILPTVAYVGGPGELAYLAQSQVLYEALLGRMAVMTARTAFTLVDGRAQKLMRRYGLNLPSLFHGEESERRKIAEKLIPGRLGDEFRAIEQSTRGALESLRAHLEAFDPSLAAASHTSRSKILYQLAKLERKVERETLRRDGRATDDANFLLGLLFPEKHLQERLYSILPFIAKHGAGLLDTLYEAIHLDCPDHKALALESEI